MHIKEYVIRIETEDLFSEEEYNKVWTALRGTKRKIERIQRTKRVEIIPAGYAHKVN